MGENIRDLGIISPSEDMRKHNEQVVKWIVQGMEEGIAAMTDGYISPIESVYLGVQSKMEKDCLEVVHRYGFNVDEKELKRALAYDRDQYNKGYEDARRRFETPVLTCEGCFHEGKGGLKLPCVWCSRQQNKVKRDDYYKPIYDYEIEILDLSSRSRNTLRRAGIDTVGKLTDMTLTELKAVHYMGKHTLEEVLTVLDRRGLSLRKEEKE